MSVPTSSATRALVRSTGASRRAKSPTSRHARRHVRMTRSARASRSLTAGGAVILALIARIPSGQARQCPCGWALSERLRQLQKLQVSLLVWTLSMEAAYYIIGRLALVNTLRIIACDEISCTLNDGPIHTTGKQRAWAAVGSNVQCNVGAGEVYRSQSPGKVSDIAACKKSCEDDPKCKSITFFNSGWCSHFSTGCAKTKSSSNAISMRLGTSVTTKTPTGTCYFIWYGLEPHHSTTRTMMNPIECAGYASLRIPHAHHLHNSSTYVGGRRLQHPMRHGRWRGLPEPVAGQSLRHRRMPKVM